MKLVALRNYGKLTIRGQYQGNGIMLGKVYVRHKNNGNMKHENMAVAAAGEAGTSTSPSSGSSVSSVSSSSRKRSKSESQDGAKRRKILQK